MATLGRLGTPKPASSHHGKSLDHKLSEQEKLALLFGDSIIWNKSNYIALADFNSATAEARFRREVGKAVKVHQVCLACVSLHSQYMDFLNFSWGNRSENQEKLWKNLESIRKTDKKVRSRDPSVLSNNFLFICFLCSVQLY